MSHHDWYREGGWGQGIWRCRACDKRVDTTGGKPTPEGRWEGHLHGGIGNSGPVGPLWLELTCEQMQAQPGRHDELFRLRRLLESSKLLSEEDIIRVFRETVVEGVQTS